MKSHKRIDQSKFFLLPLVEGKVVLLCKTGRGLLQVIQKANKKVKEGN